MKTWNIMCSYSRINFNKQYINRWLAAAADFFSNLGFFKCWVLISREQSFANFSNWEKNESGPINFLKKFSAEESKLISFLSFWMASKWHQSNDTHLVQSHSCWNSLSLPFLSPSLSHTPAHSLRCARTHSQSRSNTQAAWHKHFSYLILSKLFQTSHLKSQPLSLSHPLSHSQLECLDWNERERERERVPYLSCQFANTCSWTKAWMQFGDVETESFFSPEADVEYQKSLFVIGHDIESHAIATTTTSSTTTTTSHYSTSTFLKIILQPLFWCSPSGLCSNQARRFSCLSTKQNRLRFEAHSWINYICTVWIRFE